MKTCSAALLLVLAAPLGHAQTLPDLITYSFQPAETKTLPGTSSTCGGTAAAADQVGNLALMALFFDNGCYTDGRYNHNNYTVERGTVTSSAAGAAGFPAYRIHEPSRKASEFLASEHAVYFRFPTVADHTVYRLEGGGFTKVVDVPAAAIPATPDFIPLSAAAPVSVSEVEGSVTYVFVPSATRVSSYSPLAAGVEGARVAGTPFGEVLKYRYKMTGTPFDSRADFSAGPEDFDNIYSASRRFFPVGPRNGGLGAVWQDQTDAKVYVTWFGADRKSPATVPLPNSSGQQLVCAAGDSAGNIYYMTVQSGNGAPTAPRAATLTKVSADGATLATTPLDSSAAGLNMVEYFKVASMRWVNGELAVMLGRRMLRSGDGLNHQGGIALVHDAATLSLKKNWGQTSGHSFESVLTGNAAGEFVGIDLGDNYPRGIHLHKFTGTQKFSRVVSTFKTEHGATPVSPAGQTYPLYPEISGGGVNFYKWSNDNRTYTELGGVEPTAAGYAVSFAGERGPGGKLLENGRAGETMFDARNVGFVSVRGDFQAATGSGMVVSDDLVLTRGITEEGGFYDFGGGWNPQRNAGVVWLTNYTTPERNASRLRMAPRPDGSLLLLWEVWSRTAYLETKGMTVAADGTVVDAETDLGGQVRLGRRDDLMTFGNGVHLVTGSRADRMLELTVIESAARPPSNVALTITRSGGNVVIDWPAGVADGVLQENTSPAAQGWTDVPGGAARPVTVPITTGASRFYRLRYTE